MGLTYLGISLALYDFQNISSRNSLQAIALLADWDAQRQYPLIGYEETALTSVLCFQIPKELA
jgi:hypothetical protein